MSHQKIFQVQYRNPRDTLEIFWAENVWEVGSSFRFVGCCTTKTATANDRSVHTYAVRLNNITIPESLNPTIAECDRPDWWVLTQHLGEAQF